MIITSVNRLLTNPDFWHARKNEVRFKQITLKHDHFPKYLLTKI